MPFNGEDAGGVDMRSGKDRMMGRPHPRGRRLLTIAALAGLGLLSFGVMAQAKKKAADAFSTAPPNGTSTGTPAAAADTSPCTPLNRRLSNHILAIRNLKSEIERSNQAPPTTVFGTFQQLLGGKYVNAAAVRGERRLTDEWNAAEEINAMLVAAQCPPVDIKQAVEDKSSPETHALESPPERHEPVIMNEPIR